MGYNCELGTERACHKRLRMDEYRKHRVSPNHLIHCFHTQTRLSSSAHNLNHDMVHALHMRVHMI